MTIGDWLKWAKTQIDTLDAELILLHRVAPKNSDRSWLVTHDNLELDQDDQELISDWVAERRSGVPLAYVLGYKEFYGRRFAVIRGVLIPRPETEALIDLIRELDLPRRARILDMGTGSGCIAITLALEFPQAYVMGVDASYEALTMARFNDTRFDGRVEFVNSDLFDGLDLDAGFSTSSDSVGVNGLLLSHELRQNERHFDVLVANLPYVSRDWDWVDTEQLKFEPKTALFAGQNGLALYRRLFAEYQQYITVHYVVVEADLCQHAELIKLAEQTGLKHRKTLGYGLLFENPQYQAASAE